MKRRLLDNILRRVTDRGYLLTLAVIVIVYVLAARLGLSLSYTTEQVTTVWPPSGIALVALLVLGFRYWPGIFVGAFIANLFVHEPGWVALGVAAGNTLEGLVGAYLLRRVFRFKNAFARPRDVAFYALAGLVGALVAGGLGPVWLALGGLIDWHNYRSVSMTWWQGDLMGVLVFGPFLLAYLNRKAFSILRGRYVEGGFLLAATFLASVMIFTANQQSLLSFPYLLFPFVMWAAIRFTQLGVVSCTLLIAGTAIWATTGGIGPFSHGSTVEQELVELQAFLAVMSATSLFMAMAITERMAAEETLTSQAHKLALLDTELKEANRRVTNILAGILDGNGKRSNDDR